jgi:hypothetical protein
MIVPYKGTKAPAPEVAELYLSEGQYYNFADNSFPALNLATFFALILITAPV